MNYKFIIDSDIANAETLPGWFYNSEDVFQLLKEKIFLKCWHWIDDKSIFNQFNTCPFFILPDYLSEPIIVLKNQSNNYKSLSNVCTHRGNLIFDKPSNSNNLICNYHGRKFDNDGKFKFMPEFEMTKNFPRNCDNLHGFPIKSFGNLLFVGFNPGFNIENVFSIIKERVGFMPIDEFIFDENLSRDFKINSHWALYCDNYLEGFHVPFVHKDLNKILDYDSYETIIYDHCNLQIGYSDNKDDTFKFPKNHIDYGKNIAAYYYWIFPNLMLNFYPWGLSVNLVEPKSINSSNVSFRSYVFDKNKLNYGAGSDLDKVEHEDEEVVENVNKGLKSSFYKTGRFSPTKEKGVHHFHLLLSKFINK